MRSRVVYVPFASRCDIAEAVHFLLFKIEIYVYLNMSVSLWQISSFVGTLLFCRRKLIVAAILLLVGNYV